MPQPQAFVSGLAPRARGYLNSFLVPVLPQTQVVQTSRKTNRGTNIINYAEDLLADEDFDDSDGPRRATGLRSRSLVDPALSRDAQLEKLSTELTRPVEVQGIWRDWMGKPRFGKYEDSAAARALVIDLEATESSQVVRRTENQLATQASLPLTLIPIRIDLDVPSFVPAPALPLPPQHAESGIDPNGSAYRSQEPTTAFRLRDFFMWNLHEAMLTPDQFGLTMVHDLDLPTPTHYAAQISAQIRQQCEEYAGVALHPLFHAKMELAQELPAPNGSVYDTAQTPIGPSTPMALVVRSSSIRPSEDVTAKATPMPSGPPDMYNPDDMYRCIVTLNVNLLNKLYTDKFEWSLLHPAGAAEAFAAQTCADLGLCGEWKPAMTHAIYEAVLRLKKEACESGGLVGAMGGVGGEIDNLALPGQEAGWRYDDEGLADEWEPKIEILSKDEIERREGERERNARRQRRETARFSSTANMAGGLPTPGSYFDQPDADTPMGRGERSKKKRRFRSLSPTGRANTPGGASEAAGWGGGGGPTEDEKSRWRCSHCQTWGNACWAIRDGPAGHRTLCNNCGLYYERDKLLPRWLKDFHQRAPPPLSAFR